MSIVYYDKPFSLITVIDLSELNKADQEAVSAHLTKKYSAWPVTYPSDFAKEAVEEVGKRGFLKFRTKPPYTLTTDEAVVLFLKCMDKFNPHAVMRTTPNTLRIQKAIVNDKDFTRIVDELTLQQDSIALANIWKLPEQPRIAFTTKDHPLNGRICREVIQMEGEYIGKRKFDEKMSDLGALIDGAIERDKVQSQSSTTEAKYRQ
jgi:hypothetical protein